MGKPESNFYQRINEIAFNKVHRELLSRRLNIISDKVKQVKKAYSDLELARTRASFIKNKTLDNLDKYLVEFESNFTKRGGKVIWAQDKDEAISELEKIIERKGAKNLLKGRSQIFEEIEISESFENKGLHNIDIGDFIQNLAAQKSYHPIFSTLNQSPESITLLLEKENIDCKELSPQQIVDLLNDKLGKYFQQSDVAISGVNFLIADVGAAVIIDIEGGAGQGSSFSKTQILIAGIEEIIPNLADMDLFLHLYSSHSSGSIINAYTHLLSGPKQSEEYDGPEEMYVILLDNGRSEILAQTNQRSALGCIKCGSCISVCPVYRNIGGHAYQSVYYGPIGSITTPLRLGMESYKYLSFASPSAMECVSVCPVKIDFPKLLQNNRTASIKLAAPGKTEKLSIFFWKTAMLKRNKMDKGGAKLKNFMLRQFFKKSWGDRREMPVVAPKSFNQIWRDRKGI